MTDKLTVVEQREVTFYDDDLTAVRGDDGQVYVAIRRMCDALGVDQRSQRRRIQKHQILSEGYTMGDISTPHRGRQRSGLLRVDLVPLWLAGIEAGKVSEDMRPKLVNFQREAGKVLWEAFQEGRLTADPDFNDLLQQDTEAVQAYKMLQALVKLAQNQILLESRIDTHDQRLEAIEAHLGDPGRAITPAQASQISQAVKAVAFAMGGKGGHYQQVYGQMYREYEITGYKKLPATRFDDCMNWLTEWHVKLTGMGLPPF